MENCHISRFQDRAHRLGLSMPLYYLVQDSKVSIVDAVKRSFDIKALTKDFVFDTQEEEEDFANMLLSPTAPRSKLKTGDERQYLMLRCKKADILLKNSSASTYSSKAYQRFVGDRSSSMTIKVFLDHSFIKNIEVDLFRLEQQGLFSYDLNSFDEIKEATSSYGSESKVCLNLLGFKRCLKSARNEQNLRFTNMARILAVNTETLKLLENSANDQIDFALYWALASFFNIKFKCIDEENHEVNLLELGPVDRSKLLFDIYY